MFLLKCRTQHQSDIVDVVDLPIHQDSVGLGQKVGQVDSHEGEAEDGDAHGGVGQRHLHTERSLSFPAIAVTRRKDRWRSRWPCRRPSQAHRWPPGQSCALCSSRCERSCSRHSRSPPPPERKVWKTRWGVQKPDS